MTVAGEREFGEFCGGRTWRGLDGAVASPASAAGGEGHAGGSPEQGQEEAAHLGHADADQSELATGSPQLLLNAASRLTSDGKLLHEGKVYPGMMRLASRGEKVEGVVYTPSEAIILHIPGAHLRARLREVSPNHQRGEVCFVNALLQPRAQVQQPGRVLVQRRAFA